MPKVISIREENSAEKNLREWFETQALASPDNLEEAARLLIGLITGLLGALFAVLTISAEKLPAYLSLPLVRWSGVAAIVFWLLSLLCGLAVVLPRRWQTAPGRPATESSTFSEILVFKSNWLVLAVITFGIGTLALGIVLVNALLATP